MTDPTMVGFFDRPETDRAIARVAGARRVTLFVGAGASLDRHLPDWNQLVADLLTKSLSETNSVREQDIPVLVQAIVQSYPPAAVATIAAQLFDEANVGRAELEVDLSKTIGKKERNMVSMATYVARLALSLKAAGRDVHIITTNYDTSIESSRTSDPAVMDIEQAHNVALASCSTVPNVLPKQVPVVHIHGLFTPEDQELVRSVLTEADYADWNAGNRNLGATTGTSLYAYMAERFSDGLTLFIGTSMRDENVTDALHQTVNCEAERLALQPLSSEIKRGIAMRAPHSVVESLGNINDARLRSFGVDSIRPDFFGQVSQFLHEVRLSVEPNVVDRPGPLRYVERLTAWAARWDQERREKSEEDGADPRVSYFDSQLSRKLSLALQDLFNRKSGRNEVTSAKLELWARTEPATRTIDLVATSNTLWVGGDETSKYKAPISAYSEFVAVEAFAARKPYYGDMPTSLSSRWTRYLAVPVILVEPPWYELPVGVLVLFLKTDRELGREAKALGFTSEERLAFHLARLGQTILSFAKNEA